MSAVLSRNDFHAARNVIRWAGIGLQPKNSYGAQLSEITGSFDESMTIKIRFIADQIKIGQLPAQDVCKQADLELQRIYEQGQVEVV